MVKNFCALSLTLALLAGCHSKSGSVEDEAFADAETLFRKARQLTAAGEYQEAADKLEQLQRENPTLPLATEAQVRRAYALYLGGQFEAAVDVIDAFIQQHPAHEVAPYMLYLKAMCYYDQVLDVGRDQDLSLKAQEALKSLLQRFAGTKYARDAELKLEYIHNLLAGKEMDIARFYLQKGEMIAALGRFRNVVQEYQTTIFIEEALYRLAEIYYALGEVDQARVNATMLGYNYPNSVWHKKALEVLEGKNTTVQMPWYQQIQKELW